MTSSESGKLKGSLVPGTDCTDRREDRHSPEPPQPPAPTRSSGAGKLHSSATSGGLWSWAGLLRATRENHPSCPPCSPQRSSCTSEPQRVPLSLSPRCSFSSCMFFLSLFSSTFSLLYSFFYFLPLALPFSSSFFPWRRLASLTKPDSYLCFRSSQVVPSSWLGTSGKQPGLGHMCCLQMEKHLHPPELRPVLPW